MKLLNVQNVDSVKTKVLEKFENIISIEDMETEKALNYYLAEDVISPICVPEFNKSSCSGVAA